MKTSSKKFLFDFLQIDPAPNCNLRCMHCFRASQGNTWKKRPMSLSLFTHILQFFSSQNVKSVCLSGGGEILTVPYWTKMVELLKEKGIPVCFFTNGMLLKKDMINYIVKEQLVQSVYFSIERVHKMNYERVRRGAKFQTLIENINFFSEAKRKSDALSPTIIFNFTMMASNLHELPLLVHLALSLGVGEINIAHILPLSEFASQQNLDKIKWHTISTSINKAYVLAKECNIRISLDNYFLLRKKGPHFRPFCAIPFKTVVISHNGNVYPCCVLDGKLSFGNIADKSFEEIYFSEEYTKFREDLVCQKPSSFCRECDYYWVGSTWYTHYYSETFNRNLRSK